MFKVVTKHLFWWPVTVRMPDPDEAGKLVSQSFEMQFLALPRDRAMAIDEAVSALPPEKRPAHIWDFIVEVSRNWRGVVNDDKQEVPFSAELLRLQLEFPWFGHAVAEAYSQASRGEAGRLGN